MTNKLQGELLPVLEQIERDKGIKKEDLINTIESAIVSAFHKHSGNIGQMETKIDLETGAIKAYLVKKVVETVADPLNEISFEEAKKTRPKVKVDTEIRMLIDTEDFSRIAAQTAKQVIIQKIREIEKDNLFQEFQAKQGQLVTGYAHRFVDGNIVVDMGKVEGILPLREQVRGERFNIGDRIRVVILKVEKNPRGPQIVVSRSHPDLVKRLFEQEVPELYDRTVSIVNLVREPGVRTKLMVKSSNPRVDPVGSCVGVKGSRVKPIIDELHQERIDLIPYTEDVKELVTMALAPAKISEVKIIDPMNKRMEVLVEDNQLSLTIGKNGQNVRLAARLSGWHIDIKSESQRKKEVEEVKKIQSADIQSLDGLGPKLIEKLQKAGFTDVARLSTCQVEDLMTLQGVGEKTAEKIIKEAKEFLASGKLETKIEEKTDANDKPQEDNEKDNTSERKKEDGTKTEE